MRPLLIVFVSTLALGLVAWAWRVPADAEDSTTRSEKPVVEGADHWAFQPLRIVKSPEVVDAGWCQTAVDPFVLRELESRKIGPAVPADKRGLLRRVTYDLIGLPPTPEAMAEFLADDSGAAYGRVVERLLASPQYGERWGRHWLDVVRYADARDLIQLPVESDFREAWRYRDWVVSAFNRDLPYDKFIAMQVAGDVLQPADPAEIDVDALVATGFLAIADFVPGDVDKTQMIADYVNDQVDVLGRSVMGLTLGCARCHDHKYDPISIEDYYSLAGIFFSTRLIPSPIKGNTPLVRVPLVAPQKLREIEADSARDKARLAALPLEIATHVDRAYVASLRERIAKETRDYLLAAWACSTARPEGNRPTTTVVATDRRLDNETLQKWVALFDESPIHPAIVSLRETADEAQAGDLADRLVRDLKETATKSSKSESTPAGAPFAESQILRFRAVPCTPTCSATTSCLTANN
ncbi:MAG: DUF1549 domain-containing protein [Planctomycetota bacterium]|nr:DUF1549 domain-containing protein [Planctomycetota bacterium]